ncbi:hypothetical protein [Embleya sp. NBC_00896]|uniref:hypothetical protein n=1 Tax=Embleya sp. NBC_00896 TaxID=2975961 RepID=UPI00386417F7|nr:hypothetical protein OG928_05260 [Embleya sp. NBC_00896]
MPEIRVRAVAALTCLLLSTIACGSDRSDRSGGNDDTPAKRVRGAEPTEIADPGPAPLLMVNCLHAINAAPGPSSTYTTFLGDVAFETDRTLQTSRAEGTEYPHRLFAKSGVAVRDGAVVDIQVVPDPDNGTSVAWGSPGPFADLLRIPGCTTGSTTDKWMAFPGGFYVDKPGCVTLIVRAHGEQTRVHIPVGAAC